MSKREEKLSASEWQARRDAACAIVARKYCDMFKFWRDCRYKPCRSARRCIGNPNACLGSRWHTVPYDAGIAAHRRMAADTPSNANRFAFIAHHLAHDLAYNRKNQNIRAKTKEKTKDKTPAHATPSHATPPQPRS